MQATPRTLDSIFYLIIVYVSQKDRRPAEGRPSHPAVPRQWGKGSKGTSGGLTAPPRRRAIGLEAKFMRIVGIIPARYQSSRFPGKPLVDILGKPMIRHVYERSDRAACLDRLIVATDDARIAAAVAGFGGEALLTRADHASGTDRLAEAARLLELDGGDIVVNIQGDEPLVDHRMIEALVEALQHDRDCPMATLAFPAESLPDYNNPNVVKVVVDRGLRALYFSRAPIPFVRDGAADAPAFLKHLGFYAYSASFLQTFARLPPGRLEGLEKLEQLRALEHGYRIRVTLSPVDTRGVDTSEDLEAVAPRLAQDAVGA